MFFCYRIKSKRSFLQSRSFSFLTLYFFISFYFMADLFKNCLFDPSENPTTCLVQPVLDGNNYYLWSQSMVIITMSLRSLFYKTWFPLTRQQKCFFFFKNKKVCVHYERNGHVVEVFYRKHGFPPGYKFNNLRQSINNVEVV